MKDLLLNLTRSTVSICFKSGDKIDNVVIEAVMGNTMVANYEGKITLIEISHIAYVSTETGIMGVMESILKNTQDGNKNGNKDSSKDSSK